MVTCYNGNRMKEYIADGSLVHTVELHTRVGHPYHALKLANGQFVVSHADLVHVVSLVDADK